MAQDRNAWLVHHRNRFIRPDAHRYVRPDAYRFMRPDAPRLFGKDAVRYFWPDFTVQQSCSPCEAKFDPDQPRVPAGSVEGGQWIGATSDASELGLPEPSLAAMSRIAKCEAQWLTDVLICRTVRNAACYNQAMVRLIACEKGQSIPPLTY